MSYTIPLFSTNEPCDEAIDDIIRQLQDANFQVARTFDLQVARTPYATQVHCDCPNHGTEQCDCQMVVLLVYPETQKPISLIAHGRNGRTWFDLVDTPEQRADTHCYAMIRQTLLRQGA
jgi:hypothetical protein